MKITNAMILTPVSPPARRRPSFTLALLTLALSLEGVSAHAQSVPPATAADPAASAPMAAPTLSPAPRKGRASSAAAAAKPAYAPIPVNQGEAEVGEVDMFVGESRVFPAPGVARIAVGNGKLLTASSLDDKEVILFANGEGTSSLFVWHADGRYQRVKINIRHGDTTRVAREVVAFLSKIPNTRASVIGANIIVEGEQLSDFDREKIEQLAKRYPQVINFTHHQSWEKMVALDVKVVEFPTTLLRQTGLKWSSTGGAAVGAVWSPFSRLTQGGYGINIATGQNNAAPIFNPSGEPLQLPTGVNVLSAMNMGLNAQLNLLAQEGRATLLAEPQLSTRSGSKASFTAGGEIPYAVSTRDGTYVQFKTYGVKLDIEPKVDAQGHVRAKVSSEVSSIDRSVSTLAGPALLTRQTTTEFNVRAGETIVLAGLLQREAGTDIDKVPVLGDIPVLGTLFRSKNFQNKETELVIFVTPTVASASSPGNVDRIQQTQERLQERLGPTPYLSDPLQPGVSYEQPNQTPRVQPAAPQARPNDPTLPMSMGHSAAGALLRVTAQRTEVRAQARADAEVLLTLQQGATLTLGAGEAREDGAGRWVSVSVGGLSGWVSSEAVTAWRPDDALISPARAVQSAPAPLLLGQADDDLLAGSMRVTGEAQALRQAPHAQAGVVALLGKGETVRALNVPPQGTWQAVQVRSGPGAMRGWLPAQWLVPMTAP